MSDGLVVEDLIVRFGGLSALSGVSLEAPVGRLTGLIGPNGAGKTTCFNVCSGLQRPTEGSVSLFGADVTKLSPAGRARMGLGRTFQQVRLFDVLTVRENVELGHEAALAGARPWRHLVASRRERQITRQRSTDALERCGISHLASRRPPELSTGQRRLTELARAIAGGFRLLLLDEPSSGLDRNETERFGQILRDLVDADGIGILCVEHDMSLVMSICDHIHVIDFGCPIFEGSPEAVQASEDVRAAYLGDESVEGSHA